MEKIKCFCGKEISNEQNKENERIAKETKLEKLDMCEQCWIDYCYHAVTGE